MSPALMRCLYGSLFLIGTVTAAGATCPHVSGDLTPGSLDMGSEPPTWLVQGDGEVDVTDVVALMRHVVGLQGLDWETPALDCAAELAGDVHPGRFLEGLPATWIPHPDGSRGLGDVIATLRMAVGVQQPDDRLSYYRNAKPVLDASCVGCHADGGIGPFPLESWSSVEALTPLIRDAVAEERMPPWPPVEAGCAPLDHSRALSAREAALLLSWIDDGAWEGDPLDEPDAPVASEPVEYDTLLSFNAPYTPPPDTSDDYHCFVLDWPHAEESFVTALRVLPDRADMVHHVIAYGVGPADVQQALDLDAEEAGEGYTCYGGPLVDNALWLGAWVPGTLGGAFPEDTGIGVAPGSAVIVQFHYNMDNSPAAPDNSVVELRTESSVAKPAYVMQLVESDFFIPRDASLTEAEGSFDLRLPAVVRDYLGLTDVSSPYSIHATALHMHQLGLSTSLALRQADSSEDCLLDIPEWDFHWQDVYRLAEPMLVTAPAEERLVMRCTWDNSPENQAWVGGIQQESRNVFWGDGSRDEMCFGIAYVSAP